MQKSFQYILDTYLTLPSSTDSNTEVHKLLTRGIPKKLESIIGSRPGLLFKGSEGNGNRNANPWVAVLNTNVTTTVQKGLYVCYLFKSDMSGFYLTLNQGITNFEQLYRRDKYTNAVKVSNYFRNEVGDTIFSTEDIDLVSKKGKLGYGYERTTILQKYYPSHQFTDEEMENDLVEMMKIYDSIVRHFNTSSYNDVIQNVLAYDESTQFMAADEAIDQIRNVVDPYQDIPYGFNKPMKEVEPFVEKDNKFTRVSEPRMTKIDYVKKAEKDARTGLFGEKLVLQYEQDRLASIGLEDYATKVRHVAYESDSFGYDILSYDRDSSGKVVKLYIEVKTSSSKVDTSFFVSRNEVDVSLANADHYCLFRIYDVNSQTPKFYRCFGSIEENFIIDPVAYLARLKYKEAANS